MSGGPSMTGRPSSRSTSRSVVSRPETRSLTRFWGLLADADIPVVIHAGHAPVAAAYTGPDSFAPLLARHPRLTAIIAHMGAPDYEDFVRLAEDHEHVALDTTMAFTSFFDELAPFSPGLLPRVRDLGLTGKVLLGTDFPNIPHPYAEQIATLTRLELGPDWLRAVCWDNPVRLFGDSHLAPARELP